MERAKGCFEEASKAYYEASKKRYEEAVAECEKLDQTVPQLSNYINVPCHAEWFPYIQWHNVVHHVDGTYAKSSLLVVCNSRQNFCRIRFKEASYTRAFFRRENVTFGHSNDARFGHPRNVWRLIQHYVSDYLTNDDRSNNDDDDDSNNDGDVDGTSNKQRRRRGQSP